MQYCTKNRSKFLLFCHLIFSTKYRKNIFDNKMLNSSLKDIKNIIEKKYEITQYETDRNHIHFMIKYDPSLSISQIVRHLKQQTTYYMWKFHEVIIKKNYWNKRILWADGYFVCSIGNSNPETIMNYIKNQG